MRNAVANQILNRDKKLSYTEFTATCVLHNAEPISLAGHSPSSVEVVCDTEKIGEVELKGIRELS